MPYVEQTEERLTPAERAVCYYSLPRTATPVSAGAVAVFALLVAEALAALCYGVLSDSSEWTRGGTIAFGFLVVGGLAWFFLLALSKDVRRRRVLSRARHRDTEDPDPDLPDPFAGHLLITRPLRPTGALYACTDNEGLISCFVDVRKPGKFWRVTSPKDEPLFDLLALQGPRSFLFFPWAGAQPGRMGLFLQDRKLAEIRQGFGWLGPVVHILPKDAPNAYMVRQGAVYHQNRLVGRMYALHRSVFLDIEREHLADGVLAAFISAH